MQNSNYRDRYIFWLSQPSILYSNNNYIKFIPLGDMTRVEQLNAITRLCIYLLIIALLFNGSENLAIALVSIIIVMILIYYVYEDDTAGKYKEFISRHTQQSHSKQSKSKKSCVKCNIKENMNGETGSNEPGGGSSEFIEDSFDEIPLAPPRIKEYEVESGYYDANGKLQLGKEYDVSPKEDIQQIAYSVNELLEYQKAKCRKPTKDNPFMNPPITDYGVGDVPAACNANDADIKRSIHYEFNQDLFRNVDDLFDIKNSQRQFYTAPNRSVPNDQDAFAKWLWKCDSTCKEDQTRCLRYEDLRYKSSQYVVP